MQMVTEAKNMEGRRLAVDSQSIEFGPWNISYSTSRILPSICATKVVCERDDDQFCQFCIYTKTLKIPHFPDMVFPNNILTLSLKNGASIVFSPLDALKCVAIAKDAIQVACADIWQESRPTLQKLMKSFDWTFATDYKGSLNGDFKLQPTNEQIDIELLKQKDQILFYNNLTLFEDELHDHGVSVLTVRIRVMESYWYILLQYFLRVDDVMVRTNESRFFYSLNSDYVLREYTSREAKVEDLNVPTVFMKEPTDIIPLLPITEKVMEKIIFNCENS